MALPAKVKKYLDQRKMKYEVVPHKTVFTVYDLAQTLKIKTNAIVKTLLVKADKNYHLVVLSANRRLDLTALKKTLGAKNVTLAKEKDMAKEFKTKPGAMTPFAALHKVSVVVDKGLVKTEKMLFGAGSFTESVRMRMKDYLKSEPQSKVAPISKKAD